MEDYISKIQKLEQKLSVLTANSNLAVWECFFDTRRNVYSQETVERFRIPGIVENVPEGLIQSGDVHPDSQEDLLQLYRTVMAGEPYAKNEIKVFNHGKIRWLKLQLSTIYDQGKPVSAIGTAEDITVNKELILKLEDEVTRRSAYEMNLRARGYYDLTEDRILEYDTTGVVNSTLSHLTKYSDAVTTIISQIPEEKMKKKFAERFSPENLLKAYQEGRTEITLEYRREVPGEVQRWVNTRMIVARRPSDEHIVAFLHTTDIQDQKLSETVLKYVTVENFEDIKLIDTQNSHYRSYEENLDPIFTIPARGEDFWGDLDDFIRDLSSESDYQEYCRNHNYDEIQKSLDKNRKHTFTINTRAELGSRVFKIQFAYLDKKKRYIIGTNVDITDAVANESNQKKMLESALLAAKQASSAKSDFLSKMSHEIRTPMNAILGMVALAVQADGNIDEVMDCISKIGISGHYLLTLINDILDMSRIESGKMLLNNTAFNFNEFLEGINAIIYAQAAAKDIEYEVIASHGLDDGY
ncbi:MAG: PAS domain S-box protein, partial [Clostridia bacterium]|nr:PAS domain S-box protein [Clostridia bacterium]